LTDFAGITVEISKDMVGEKTPFEPSDEFWFFAIGNGKISGVFERTASI
jgi:hypothetical protein